MKKILFLMFIITSFTALYSCSDDDNKNMSIITQTVDIPDFYTDNVSTAVEKALSYIDEYNNENDLLTKANVTKFVSEIDECPAEITQTVEFNSSIVTQELTTYCRIATFYADDYIPSPDYLSRHYTRTLNVARQEILSTVVRKYSDGEWSDWTYHTNYYCASPTHGKNIAFFGGSFAHNIIDGKKGENRYGFDYNGKTTSLLNLIADIFACKHVGNYAQGGQGIFTGALNPAMSEPFFKYNMYEQIKYSFEFSEEKGYTYDVFLLFGGINDSNIGVSIGNISDPVGDYSYIASLKKSIEFIKRKNSAASIYMLTSIPAFSELTNERNQGYVEAFIKIAKYYNLPLLDIYNLQIFTEDNYTSYYLSDKIHPNGEGYRVISPYIINLLNK